MSSHSPTLSPTPIRSAPTALWAVLLYAFLNSIGSAVVYSGLFFLAKHHYHFTQNENFALALVYGLAYIPAAYFVGPVQRSLGRRGITPRRMLAFTMIAMCVLCYLPWLAHVLNVRSSWPLWVCVGLYSPLSGAMWPVVEAYLAGGRSEHDLRSATGKFNVAWSSSLVFTLLAMGPLVEAHALLILQILGAVHLSCLGVLIMWSPSPASHDHADHVPASARSRQLLTFLRILLPVSFMFVSTLSPYLPGALAALGLAAHWETPAAATWLAARVLTFWAMERWHGWHGTWTTPIVGAIVLAAAFAVVVLIPFIAPASLGIWLMLAGLAGFGVGVGIIYASALYYAMDVGSSGVDAGGMHETLIGLGYTAGPICGLLAAGAAQQGIVKSEGGTLVMLGLVVTLGVIAAMVAGRFALRQRMSGTLAALSAESPRS